MRIHFFLLFLLTFSENAFGQKQKDEPLTYQDDLIIEWKKRNDTLTLNAKSKLLTPMQIYFHSREDSVLLTSFLLPPKGGVELLEYSGSHSDSTFRSQVRDSIRVSYYWGHESLISPDLDYPYRFPFKKGRKVEVSQTFNGKATHNDVKSKYAIDFQLDVGEIVCAARGGLVVRVIDWFSKQGGPELSNSANRIVVLHSDGTLATYAHLDYQGSLVTEGQQIEEGQRIGVAGLTGHTRGPHLHFVVRQENDVAIPIFFKGYEGKVLQQGKRYKVID